ncbi:MAG TPA: FtsX-like permease family protein [Vicinamibacterales bacterium]|nr:FtsX-like permease family protein [Vicinamibacterales bacterium]
MDYEFHVQDPTSPDTVYLFEAIIDAAQLATELRGIFAFASQSRLSKGFSPHRFLRRVGGGTRYTSRYMFTQRTREIGVRMALGARNAALKRMLLSQILLVTVIGVTLGLAGAALLTRLMETLLFGVGALDATTYVTVSAILVITAALAAYLPARRVTRIDSMQALRAE